MKPGDSTIPKFYGLPKVHKVGVPLRPIVAFRGSPTYALASTLAKRLKPLVASSAHMLKDTEDFVNKVKGISLEEGDIMVSFDIKSMFTSLPQDLLKQSVSAAIRESPDFQENEKLSQGELMELVGLCLDSTFFKFRDTVFHQKVGTPMGSPISVILAEIAVQRFEEEVMRDAPQSLRIWVRYVDDIFAVMKETDLEPFFTVLNSKNNAIQFEMEKEENGQLPFLDVLVERGENSVSTTVHRKETHTNRLLDFNSFHPASHKRSVVRTLWNRASKVCSTSTHLKEERRKLRKIFHDNGYPSRLVRRWTAPHREEVLHRQNTARVTIPYIKGPSEVAARILRKNGVSVAHKPNNTLHGTLTKLKDQVAPTEQAGVVYNINCSDCSRHYVGETGKKLSTRLSEHQRAVNREDQSSAIYQHCKQQQHRMDWQGAEVVYKERNKGNRLFLEAWASDKEGINRSITLNPVYKGAKERQSKERTGMEVRGRVALGVTPQPRVTFRM